MEEPTAKEKGLDTCSVPEAQSYDSSIPEGHFTRIYLQAEGLVKCGQGVRSERGRRLTLSMDLVGHRSIRNGSSVQRKYKGCRERTIP